MGRETSWPAPTAARGQLHPEDALRIVWASFEARPKAPAWPPPGSGNPRHRTATAPPFVTSGSRSRGGADAGTPGKLRAARRTPAPVANLPMPTVTRPSTGSRPHRPRPSDQGRASGADGPGLLRPDPRRPGRATADLPAEPAARPSHPPSPSRRSLGGPRTRASRWPRRVPPDDGGVDDTGHPARLSGAAFVVAPLIVIVLGVPAATVVAIPVLVLLKREARRPTRPAASYPRANLPAPHRGPAPGDPAPADRPRPPHRRGAARPRRPPPAAPRSPTPAPDPRRYEPDHLVATVARGRRSALSIAPPRFNCCSKVSLSSGLERPSACSCPQPRDFTSRPCEPVRPTRSPSSGAWLFTSFRPHDRGAAGAGAGPGPVHYRSCVDAAPARRDR